MRSWCCPMSGASRTRTVARSTVARGTALVVGLGLVLALIVVCVGVFIARGLVTRIRAP